MSPEHERLVEGLIGRPYREGANGPEAFDCYGVPFYLMRACGRLPLPEVERSTAEPSCGDAIAHALVEHPALGDWRRVFDPEEWDVVIMANVAERRRHLGLYVVLKGMPYIIHAQDAPVNRVILDDLPSLELKGFNRVEFFRRKASDEQAHRASAHGAGRPASDGARQGAGP